MGEVTRILDQIRQGDPHAAELLLPLVYDELRMLAAQKLAQEKPGQTLQATALVHEAYVRLVDVEQAQHWNSRGHFFAAVAEAMRRILVDQVRRKQSQRRGGPLIRCELRDDDRVEMPLDDELIDLDEALAKLASADPQAAELVKLRVFAGMTIEEVARVAGRLRADGQTSLGLCQGLARPPTVRERRIKPLTGPSEMGSEIFWPLFRADFALQCTEVQRMSIAMVEQPQSEKSIFFAAIEISSDTERAEFLEQTCAGNQLLRAEVEALLLAHGKPVGLLDALAAPELTVDQPITERLGVVIGPYKLLEQIGEGGMGSVWMAQQIEPVKRVVALKLIKAGMDSKQVIARFEAERQVLALMDHANIARVLDAGTTGAGRPYFVMDLVKGVPITRYCDEHYLTLRQRLELFIPICRAIQHAHTKGIIHRDIKPTNVLVTQQDDAPIVKVIDFGIAKAMGQRPIDESLFTDFAQLIGTPLYMSPEQAELSAADVDTCSDIYSLGVLLYELLTGSTPVDRRQLKQASFDEIRRIIREDEPPKPSTRVTIADSAPSIAACRKTDPARLVRLVRGELDWIVMKALDKDRNRRYETASGLVVDIERYLADEPVQAGPPSAAYRLRKFARRHKVGLATSVLTLCFLVLLGGGAGWIVRDGTARHAETAARIESALQETVRLRTQQSWAEARAAARRADVLLAGGSDYPDQRRRLDNLVIDLDMVDRLERVREDQVMEQDDFWVHGRADAAYEAAFRAYGIDVLRLDAPVAAQRVEASFIAEQLVTALDDWVWVSRRNARRLEQVRAIVCLADPDPWRVRFRDPSVRRNRRALEELANSPDVATQPPTTVAFLGRALNQAGTPEKAVELLTAAQRRHPDHFWLNLYLGTFLRWSIQPPPYLESAGYMRAALTLRPKAVRVHLELGGSLLTPEHVDEAIAHFRRALEIQPDYAHPHHSNMPDKEELRRFRTEAEELMKQD